MPARRNARARLASAFHGKYKSYEPTSTEWDAGGLHRIVPRIMLAWRDMPTATRWRFPEGDAVAPP
jgi:hypothetical protein